MPKWTSDASTNHLKNTYFQDINETGFALDISGNVIIRNEYSLQFDNIKSGNFIGTDISSSLIDGSTNYVFGSHCDFDRLKQWTMHNDSSFTNISSIAASSDKFVASGVNDLIYSSDGLSWSDISKNADFIYDGYKIGFKKIRIVREHEDDNSNNTITFNELQIWVTDGSNIAQYASISASTQKANDGAGNYNPTNIYNDNLNDRSSTGAIETYESTDTENTYVEIVLDEVYQSADIESLVLYSRKSEVDRMKGVRIELYDSNDLIFYSTTIEDVREYYRFDGTEIANADKSGQSVASIVDASYTPVFNKIRLARSYETAKDFGAQEIQVWTRETDLSKNETEIDAIRFEYIGGNVTGQEIKMTELQLWVNDTNVLASETFQSITYSDFDQFFVGNVLNDNFSDNDVIKITPDTGNTSLFFQLNLTNPVKYSDIQSLVLYNLYDAATFENIQLQLLDSSSNIFYSHDFDSNFLNFNIYRFDGLSIGSYSGAKSSQPSSSQIHEYDSNDATYNNSNNATVNQSITMDPVIIPSTNFDITNIAVDGSSNHSTIINNLFDTSTTIVKDDYSSYIDVSLNVDLSLNDLHSIVVYTLDNSTYDIEGVKIQLYNNADLEFEYEIHGNMSGSKAYRFDGFVSDISSVYTSDVSNVEAYLDSYNYGQKRVIDDSVATVTNIVPDISVNAVVPAVDFWNTINRIIYGNNQFIAVGNKVAAYSDNGSTWNAKSFDLANGGSEENFTGAAYGNGRFIIVADNASNLDPLPKSSTDGGQTWSPYGIAEQLIFTYNGFQYEPGYWNTINYVSSDNWNVFLNTYTENNSQYVLDITEANWSQVVHGNGVFVAISPDGPKRIMYMNDDGRGTWGLVDTSGSYLHNEWKGIAFGSNRFVAIATIGSVRVIHSTNGGSWSNDGMTGLINKAWNSVDFVNNMFVILSSSDIAISPDGLSWKMYSLYYLENIEWRNVAFLKDIYIAVGNNSDANKNFLINNGLVIDSVSLGNGSSAEFNGSVAIGKNAICSAPNQIALGAPGTTVRVDDSIIRQY